MTTTTTNDGIVQGAISRYFDRTGSTDPFMTMSSLSLAVSGKGLRWSTKECFSWCESNQAWLEANGYEFRPSTWGIVWR